MITVLALTGMLADMPQWHEQKHESRQQTEKRLFSVAWAIRQAADKATCYGRTECEPVWAGDGDSAVAILVTLGWWESRFAPHVIAGKCRGWECDPVKLPDGRIFHKAAGAWQVHAAGPITVKEWQGLPGNVDAQAWAAIRVLGSAQKTCRTMAGTVSMYATGRWCGWSKAARRLRTYSAVLKKVRTAQLTP